MASRGFRRCRHARTEMGSRSERSNAGSSGRVASWHTHIMPRGVYMALKSVSRALSASSAPAPHIRGMQRVYGPTHLR